MKKQSKMWRYIPVRIGKQTALLVLLLVASSSEFRAIADEFPYFSVLIPIGKTPIQANGYVYDGKAVEGKVVKKIRVFPLVREAQAKLDRSGTVTVSFIASQFPTQLSQQLRTAVAQSVPDVNDNASVDGVPLSNLSFVLLVDGIEVQKQSVGGRILGTQNQGFVVSSKDSRLVSRIMAGAYEVRADCEVRLAEFSGLNLEFSRTDISTAHVTAFKEVVSNVQKSGGKILFWDWSKTVAKHSTTLRTKSETSSQSQSSLHLVLTDDEKRPDMLERLNGYLGLIDLNEGDCLTRHENSLKQALKDGDNTLAEVHQAYLEAIKLKDPDREVNALKAAADLSKGKILKFLADGVAFGTGKGEGQMRFSATTDGSTISKFGKDFEETVMQTAFALVNYGTKPGPAHFAPTLDELHQMYPAFFSNKPISSLGSGGFLNFNYGSGNQSSYSSSSLRDYIFVQNLMNNMAGFISNARNDVRFAWIASELPEFRLDNTNLNLGWTQFTPNEIRERFGEKFYQYWVAALGIEQDNAGENRSNGDIKLRN